MRVVLHSEIRPGAEADYVRRHARIPDDLVATFTRIGIRDWTIWRSGERLFHLVDCDDWDAARAALADDPADHAWQADIGRFVELFRDSDGAEGTAPLAEVWDLRAQREG
ncbi:L-rhamnose mutarotase [Microbacterium excoecariae]|uniref:L-rhamnose mutarotase n=1 Tax=Microbacterium excoecariae TaxID=2715210 RepID=UPI00140962E5|nr:L-rhamnose mutarotase [Microbacterium excoecariae]NHI17784.1 L-rhamnose mutarotase [Microbacterium excoecariae]